MNSKVGANLVSVPLEPEADAIRIAFDAQCEAALRSADDDIERSLVGKLVEQAMRVALCIACMRTTDPDAVVIQADDMRKAKGIVWHAMRCIQRDAARAGGGSQWERIRADALAWFRAGERTGTQWTRWAARRVEPRKVAELMQSLLDANEVRQVERGRGVVYQA